MSFLDNFTDQDTLYELGLGWRPSEKIEGAYEDYSGLQVRFPSFGSDSKSDSNMSSDNMLSDTLANGGADKYITEDDLKDVYQNNGFLEYLQGLMASQGQEATENRLFNALEAQKNRDFQERMSNTSYQRAVADLQKAGLNPILAYQQGGASQPSGASAQINSTGGDTVGSVITSISNLVSSLASSASAVGSILKAIFSK